MSFLIGIDGGGTSCRAVLADTSGKRLGEGRAGPANIVTDMKQGLDNILEASLLAAKDAGHDESILSECSAVLGLAGANIGNRGDALLPLLPFAKSRVETDARIALQGALENDDGAVAIVGTGSVFISQLGGKVRSIGGWGFAVGDFCSGARLGRTLLQQVLLAYDKVHSGSELTEAVMVSFGDSPEKLVDYAQTARPSDFGTFAPLIFEYADEGDPIASAIVDEAVGDLEESLDALIKGGNLPFCLLGGLACNYSKRLSNAFKSRQLSAKGNALQGALSMAALEFGNASQEALSHG